ncbi:response regulator [Xanthobacter autotrophicus]|uniref:chemotaxis protein CheB n=1 Tax=Xanthobacter TaxID=279 RepID=UPI0024AABB3F|nr:chemotaxis protein CheB [Xanthobacter autotrophicus]MDI4664120.1 response regulator [Xanthobacter autotrophicus]
MPGKNGTSETKAGRRRSRGQALVARGPPHASADFPIVGIGASAGGLEACTKLLGALPPDNGMAFILVQHLDPTHESMMAELLAYRTAMTVVQATNGMLLERQHLYIIPPGTYLSVSNGTLHLSEPEARHGARLPFDFLLRSLAEEYGERAICVILSGTGADGSLGLKAVKEKGGLVIAQNPDEAAFDGMPRNAILTGAVDLVLPLTGVPDALVKFHRRMALTRTAAAPADGNTAPDWLPEIVDLLRKKTAHDFRLYKEGTLRRRIERRMAMASIETDDIERYLDALRNDEKELNQLASDLLINVTSFFRDPKIFDVLSQKVVPDLVRNHSIDQPLRIWIAGCSTGEETYSLAMLFREEITAAKREIKLQIFASDVDPDAVATAREGLYPETIAAEVSAARLTRFFSKDEHGYRILPELRATIVFAVQDVLADPPFSRLDLISCRNLLIYLRPEAQEKVISFFHFALREGGILLLGSAETIGNSKGRFEVISKAERIYRHIGRARPGEAGFLFGSAEGARLPLRAPQGQTPSRQVALAEGCRRLIVEMYAPAAVLINSKLEWLYSLGPTERYLRVPQGHPSYDVLAMVRPHLRIKLRAAIYQAIQEKARIVIPGGRMNYEGKLGLFEIAVQPAVIDGEDLLLVCFIESPATVHKRSRAATPPDREYVAELEQQLEATRTELQAAVHSLETSNEEQKAVNEEALSANEEYQSTNEELLTSKEELQSMNEELTALNSQLQETLERQRTTASDLQNILYSTDVATIFLDLDLGIRFFTPATKALFNIIATDIGRPLADLNSLADDGVLLADARTVLQTLAPIEREIQARNGLWYVRRILPYRAQNDGVEGVVITFADITERKHTADALEAAKRDAQQASIAKSRFLAAASHDLRQPLQAISLMQSALTRKIRDHKIEEAIALVARLDETAAAMSGMLNTLLDINQLEAGTVHPEFVSFPIGDMLERLRDEFSYHATAQKLVLRVVPCGLSVYSDPRLLEQMVRNLLSNALKYTTRGKVLLGCRRHGEMLRIEVCDTGAGIAEQDIRAIFDEYHQLDNPARERSRGLGLGLSIVQRLAILLGHPVHVRSQPGKGSIFSIDVMFPADELSRAEGHSPVTSGPKSDGDRHTGAILVVEDDRELRELIEVVLSEEEHRPATAPDGPAALDLVVHGGFQPDLILADYNLPNGMDGLLVATKIRERLHRHIPVVVLTGDISTDTLRRIAGQDCLQLNKPVKTTDVLQAIQRLLSIAQPARHPPPQQRAEAARHSETSVIFIVDDDGHVRDGIRDLLEADGRVVEDFASCEAFLEAYRPGQAGCLLVDAYLPGMTGLELLERLHHAGNGLPAIMITGNSDVPMAVQAMKAGARDFIEKPIGREELLASVARALEQAQDAAKLSDWRKAATDHIASLTPRQRQVMDLVLAGHPSKNIAADLNISQRTVENHRAAIMKRTGAKSLPALARLALAAASGQEEVTNT